MTIRASSKLRNNMMNAWGFGDVGNDAGFIWIFDGSAPTDPDAAISGFTILGVVTTDGLAKNIGVNSISLETAADHLITKTVAETWKFLGIATGTAGWWSYGHEDDDLAQDDVLELWPRLQGSCGVSTGDMRLSTTSIVSGQTYTVDAFSVNMREILSV